MSQNQMIDPVLPDGTIGAELLLFGAADVVVVLHSLLAGTAAIGANIGTSQKYIRIYTERLIAYLNGSLTGV